MKNYVVNLEERSIKFSISTGEFFREYLEQLFEDKFGYHPMLQESEDDGLEMYLHTDSYETLNESELAQLDILGVTESDSLSAICSIFSIEIEQWADEEIASCSKCGKDYHENDVNMIDYDNDVCKNCLPQYIESLFKNLHKGTNNLSLELWGTTEIRVKMSHKMVFISINFTGIGVQLTFRKFYMLMLLWNKV